MSNAEHFRLSLDGKTIWNDFEKQIQITSQTNTLFLHDYNLNNIENSDIILKELIKRMNKGAAAGHIGMKFPIKVDNDIDLIKWSTFKPTKNFFLMTYNGIMNDEALNDFIFKQKGTSLSKQLEYCITYGLDEKEVISNMIKIYYQLIFLKEQHQKIILTYENNFFTDKRWEIVIKLFNTFINSILKLKKEDFEQYGKTSTLFDFVSSFKEYTFFSKDIFSKQNARDIFLFVKDNNYDLFKEFYECRSVKLKGGIFQNESK